MSRPKIPLFERYTVEELAKLTDYSESTLLALKEHRKPLSKSFRFIIKLLFPASAAELLGEE